MNKGFLLLLISAFVFSLSTVFAKLVLQMSQIPAVEITFFRFLSGFIGVLFYISICKKSIVPNKFSYIFYRALFNSIAVICFFIGIKYTTITNANLLNMTYPIFVFFIAPFINKESVTGKYYLYLIITVIGLYLLIIKNPMSLFSGGINIGDLFALASAILASFAITTLREARKYDDSHVILLYLMGIGTVINFFLVVNYFVIPKGLVLIYLIISTACSVFGQFCITFGYKFIDASAGSLVSSSRIIFAAILGVIIFSDEITVQMGIGTLLIVVSLFGISGIGRKIRQYLKISH